MSPSQHLQGMAHLQQIEIARHPHSVQPKAKGAKGVWDR